MKRQSLGIIEITGLATAVACADIALKTANVQLLGYENVKGSGLILLKLEGDIGAVQAAIKAAESFGRQQCSEVTANVIPRPSEGCWEIADSTMKSNPNPVRESDTRSDMVESGTLNTEQEVDNLELLTYPVSEELEKDSEVFQNISVEIDNGETQTTPETPDIPQESEVCNICNDPKCPRRKGEPRSKCKKYRK